MHNPFTDAPRLAPSKRYSTSRTPSPSPDRNYIRNRDSILRNLSPTRTLRAFLPRSKDVDREEEATELARSIEAHSEAEKALGARAAQICLDVRSWVEELSSWEWPGHFNAPSTELRKKRMSTMTFESLISQADATSPDNEDGPVEYWGSLPAATVQAHEARVEEISKALDTVNVQELKDYVLKSHYRKDSQKTTQNGSADHPATLAAWKRLDDYTALITATILQTLPFLNQLYALIDTWNIRLTISTAVPAFLRDLKRARTDLNHGWASIAVSSSQSSSALHASFSRETMLEMKTVIEQQVRSLGARLDHILDDLEGRNDTVPTSWIDDFEQLEAAYGEWVVQAERKVLDTEFRATQINAAKEPSKRISVISATTTTIVDASKESETEDPAQDHDAVVQSSPVIAQNQFEPPSPTRKLTSAELSRPIPQTPKSEAKPSTQTPTTIERVQQEAPAMGPSPPVQFNATKPVPDSPDAVENVSHVARTRAAFLGNIERSNSLNKSKSPVRPFEHASNAFTRLFKKDKSPEQRRPKTPKKMKFAHKFGEVQPQERLSESSAAAAASAALAAATAATVKSTSEHHSTEADNSGHAAATAAAVTAATENVTPRQSLDHAASGAASPNVNSLPSASVAEHEADPSDEQVLQSSTNMISELPADEFVARSKSVSTLPATHSSPNLLSPFRASYESSQFPENWPLSIESVNATLSPEAQSARELAEFQLSQPMDLSSPTVPVTTNTFDEVFVQGIPLREHQIEDDEVQGTFYDASESIGPESRSRPSSSGRASVVADGSRPMTYLDNIVVGRNRPLSTNIESRRVSVIDGAFVRPASVLLEANNGMAEPSLAAGHEADIVEGTDAAELPGASIGAAELEAKVAFGKADTDDVIDGTSIPEPQPRQESVDVNRKRRSVSRPQTPPTFEPSTANSPMSYDGLIVFPTPPTRTPTLRDRPTSLLLESPTGPHPNALRSHPVVTQPTEYPFGAAVKRPTGMDTKGLASTADRRQQRYSIGNETAALTISPSKKNSRTKPGEDSFDRHVSEVLEKLPAKINFKPRPGAETPVPRNLESRAESRAESRTDTRPKTTRVASRTLTIAPADSTVRKTSSSSSSSSEPEVKLYYLTQAGREEPIKLFVRLVGEGERVMVRVGGGWADLADFLRQYAEHHGSRTSAEGNLEIRPVTGSGTRKVSGVVEGKGKMPGTPTPVSRSDSGEDERGDQVGESASVDAGEVVAAGSSAGVAAGEGSAAGSGLLVQTQTKTNSQGSSRPSSPDSVIVAGRNGGTPTASEEKGLSGHRKSDLPEHKARWVEGMLERAKKASSAEKPKDGREKHFGELGKAGATRRVIFRSSSSAAGIDKQS